MRKITIAYSPDTDDAFMVHAMKAGLIDCKGLNLEFINADIEHLNNEAIKGTYDITAISIAAYPDIANNYKMMAVGASIGDNFGPAVVVNEDSEIQTPNELAGKNVAVPGKHTSAFFAAMDLFGPFNPVFCRFDNIENAVKENKAAAGILIHEPQLTCEIIGLRKIADLGQLWQDKYKLPLPLGANAIKRDLGQELINTLEEVYKNSIEYALANRNIMIEKANQAAITPLPFHMAEQYIEQYVNQRSLELHDDVQAGMLKLFESGLKFGLTASIPDIH
ncbi:MAG: MqnA/MqnD/SBP family protein [Bdellovibrionota bacterium]